LKFFKIKKIVKFKEYLFMGKKSFSKIQIYFFQNFYKILFEIKILEKNHIFLQKNKIDNKKISRIFLFWKFLNYFFIFKLI